MTTYRVYRPLHDWNPIRYRMAEAIAASLPADLLRLSTSRLVADIRAVYGCAERTAMRAVGMARKSA